MRRSAQNDAKIRKDSNALFGSGDGHGSNLASGGLRWIWGPGNHGVGATARVDHRIADHRQQRRKSHVDLEFHQRHVLHGHGRHIRRREGHQR